MYKKGCGFDPDWNCDCEKCVLIELLLFHHSIEMDDVLHGCEEADISKDDAELTVAS